MTPPGQLPRRQRVGPQGDAVWFVDDEDGYDRWRRQHQGGFVLNCEREPNARYLMLHRVSCPAIAGVPPEATIGRPPTPRPVRPRPSTSTTGREPRPGRGPSAAGSVN